MPPQSTFLEEVTVSALVVLSAEPRAVMVGDIQGVEGRHGAMEVEYADEEEEEETCDAAGSLESS